MWLTLAAAGFFALITFITLLRAEKSVANGALTVITLLAIGIAAAATLREFAPGGRGGGGETQSQPVSIAMPALACIDDLAGETVLTACEKALFGSAESAAAALSYAASQITRVTAFGDVAAANASMTSEQLAARRAVERDRYGLMAYVLAVRDHCTASECAAFRALADHRQISANIDDRVYEGLIMRYASSWNAPAAPAPVAALATPPLVAKPTNADFPSAASTPPVNIMSPEPSTAPRPPPSANATAPSPRPVPKAAPAVAAAKKPAAPKSLHAPAQLTPPAPAPEAAPAPAQAND
jgi:hypothetical protein